eukprot:scaffold8391_cov67-Cyclotella_meneghiniana.AAC.5
MPRELYFNHPVSKAIFTNTPLPPGTKSLLVLALLGLKFCIRHRKPTNNIQKSLERFQDDVRTKVWVTRQEEEEGNNRDFNPKLYLKNPQWESPPVPGESK